MKNIFKLFICLFFLFVKDVYAKNLNVIGLGIFDFNKQKNEAIDFRYESRLDRTLLELGPDQEPLYLIKPFYGIEVTSDNALYMLGGIFFEEKIYERFFLTPNFGFGYYSNGDGKDLGHSVQFRTAIEISRTIESGDRIGLSFSHISNAGLENINPGSEIISLSYQF